MEMIETVQAVRALKSLPAVRTEALVTRVADVLKTSGYPALRNVVIEHHESIIVLRGQVPTFYLKQVAQAAVTKVRGVGCLVNQICVDCAPTGS
jgi:hypothetical protein